jgi:hypothetical protein
LGLKEGERAIIYDAKERWFIARKGQKDDPGIQDHNPYRNLV